MGHRERRVVSFVLALLVLKISLLLIRMLKSARKVVLVPSTSQSDLVTAILKACVNKTLAYVNAPPALAIDPSGHLHTIIGGLLRKKCLPDVSVHREVLKLADGGSVGLDYLAGSEALSNETDSEGDRTDVPTVILLHGLCGGSESFYIRSLAKYLTEKRKWRVLCMVSRGCGEQRHLDLSTPEGFTAARTQDFRETVLHLKGQYPDSPMYAVGFSLGAGLLGLYCGEEGETCLLRGATLINPSFDFLKKTKWFPTWSRNYLNVNLKHYTMMNREMLAKNPKLDIDWIMDSKNVREYDRRAIVQCHGYEDVDAYYRDSSMTRVSHNIHVPTLCVVANDDPVCDAAGVTPPDTFGPGLAVAVTNSGGHCVGAEGWAFAKGPSWYDKVVLDWIDACIAQTPSASTGDLV